MSEVSDYCEEVPFFPHHQSLQRNRVGDASEVTEVTEVRGVVPVEPDFQSMMLEGEKDIAGKNAELQRLLLNFYAAYEAKDLPRCYKLNEEMLALEKAIEAIRGSIFVEVACDVCAALAHGVEIQA